MIEKVHGLQATSISLNERFTILSAAAPTAVARPQRRQNFINYYNPNQNLRNQKLIDQITRRLEMQAKRQALKHRLGMMRRFGSESNLPGLRRSNSFGNLSQSSFKSRGNWRQSNGNLSRAASFGNISNAWRGLRQRGGQRQFQGRLRSGSVPRRVPQLRTQFRGRARGQMARGTNRGQMARGTNRGQMARGTFRSQMGRGTNRGNARGQMTRGAGRGRGGMRRNQPDKIVPSKEELDLQLDQYMAGTKAALDKELETYMNNAMDLEI